MGQTLSEPVVEKVRLFLRGSIPRFFCLRRPRTRAQLYPSASLASVFSTTSRPPCSVASGFAASSSLCAFSGLSETLSSPRKARPSFVMPLPWSRHLFFFASSRRACARMGTTLHFCAMNFYANMPLALRNHSLPKRVGMTDSSTASQPCRAGASVWRTPTLPYSTS
jgi:hypothetical protein